MAAHTAAESLSAETIQILGGHWAGSVAKTGNFVFTINGKIPFEEIVPFAAALISPLKVGELRPLDRWLWTQLREVPTTGQDGVVYDNDTLTAELLRNPVFYGVTLCTLAHWQKSVEKVMHDAEATLQVSYLDETGEITKAIQRSEIHMFGRRVKFFVIGNNPRLAQCSRCHDIGHKARSPLCKLPANAVKCHLCGGSHHSLKHDHACKGIHKVAGKCDCKRKCILCKGSGHHARSRNCPKRGNFAPPPLTKHEERGPLQHANPTVTATAAHDAEKAQEADPAIESFVTTQREPSGQEEPSGPEDIPAPRKAKKKKVGKRGKGSKGQTLRAGSSFSILDTLTPQETHIDDFMEGLDVAKGWGTETLRTGGWGNPGDDEDEIIDNPEYSQDGSCTQLHSAPALRIVEVTMLLSREALWEHYERKGPDETPMCHWHEEIERGWGGMRLDGGMNTHEALGLRARYAAQQMMPTTGPEVMGRKPATKKKRAIRRHGQRPTALEALGARVPADGPRADVVAVPPWEVPIWEARMNHMGTTRPQERKRWVDDLYKGLNSSDAAIINVAGTISNQGRFDNLMVGGSAATLTTPGKGGVARDRTKQWGQGTDVVQNDVALFGLAKAAEWLQHYYAERPLPKHVYFLCQNSSALQGITKVLSHDNQNSVLLFHRSLTTFCSQHSQVGVTLVWSPVNRKWDQDTATRHKALEVCKLTLRASLNRVQSAAYQKQVTRRLAFTKWAEEWHEERHKCYGRDSFAYEYALTKPLSRQNHLLWKAAVDKTDGIPCFSRHTTTTALRLAVGHAFTSDYTRQFRPDIPEDENYCTCGFPDHSFHHILYDCPQYTEARQSAGGQRQWDDESPLYYFGDAQSSKQLLDFLQISRAAFLPPQRTGEPHEPG